LEQKHLLLLDFVEIRLEFARHRVDDPTFILETSKMFGLALQSFHSWSFGYRLSYSIRCNVTPVFTCPDKHNLVLYNHENRPIEPSISGTIQHGFPENGTLLQ
jgi:hypothetical protein